MGEPALDRDGVAVAIERMVDVQLRWSDIDTFGHVNNVVFFRLLEEARAKVLREAGDTTEFLTTGVVVGEQMLRYLAPLDYRQETVAVGMRVDHVGTSSFRLASRIVDPASGTEFASGYVSLIAYSFAAQSPRPLTDSERDWLLA